MGVADCSAEPLKLAHLIVGIFPLQPHPGSPETLRAATRPWLRPLLVPKRQICRLSYAGFPLIYISLVSTSPRVSLMRSQIPPDVAKNCRMGLCSMTFWDSSAFHASPRAAVSFVAKLCRHSCCQLFCASHEHYRPFIVQIRHAEHCLHLKKKEMERSYILALRCQKTQGR